MSDIEQARLLQAYRNTALSPTEIEQLKHDYYMIVVERDKLRKIFDKLMKAIKECDK